MLNILLVGAQGVGKTTLANELSNYNVNGYNINPIKGVTREYVKHHNLTTGYDTTYTDMFAYFALFLSAFNNAPPRGMINVYDRFILDVLVYGRLKYARMDYLCQLGEEIMVILKPRIHGAIYLPIEFGIYDDGFRNLDAQLQKAFDHEAHSFLTNSSIPFATARGSIEHRKQTSMIFIKSLINKYDQSAIS